jgi:MFS transporter, DHA2 family, multidrug resistance protein
MVEHLTPGSPTAAQAFATLHAQGMGTEQSYALVNRLVDGQAFMMAADDIFYVSGIIFILMIGLVWLARPQLGTADSAASSGAH